MEDSRNIIKAIDALTVKAGGTDPGSKNITEAIDNLKAVFDQKAIGIDKTLTQEGVAADAKAVGDEIIKNKFTIKEGVYDLYGINAETQVKYDYPEGVNYRNLLSAQIVYSTLLNGACLYVTTETGGVYVTSTKAIMTSGAKIRIRFVINNYIF